MTVAAPEDLLPALAHDWTAVTPGPADIGSLTRLVRRHEAQVRGQAVTDIDEVEELIVGRPSWMRTQLVVRDERGQARIWARLHDRARGRVVLDLVVDTEPELQEHLEGLADAVMGWTDLAAAQLADLRGIPETQVDANSYLGDERVEGWLTAAGFRKARTWLHQSRPVTADEGARVQYKPGVSVRRIDTHEAVPLAQDLRAAHRIIESAFTDHFNHFHESTAEFVTRMELEGGHDFALWFLAELELEDRTLPVGALVGSRLGHDEDGMRGLYVEYIGVGDAARGHGVGTALLHTAIAKAARRGWSRVDLEVDADSPTSAHELYSSMGWKTEYTTVSWHKDVRAGAQEISPAQS